MKLNPASFWILPILAGLVSIGPLSTDMYLPAQPVIKEQLNASIEQIQLTLSIFLIGTSIGLPFWGPLADRFGRKPIIVAGVVLFIVSSIACAFASSIESLIVFRFFQALGACVGPTIGRTMVRDIYTHEGAARAFSHLATFMALAPALAPIAGGYFVEHASWQAIFYTLAICAAISTGVYLYFIGETLRPELRQSIHPQHIWNNYTLLTQDRLFLSYTLILSMVFSGLFAFISGAAFVFIEFLQLGPTQFGYCFLGMVIGFVSGTNLGARLAGRLSTVKIVLMGVLLASMSAFCGLLLSLFEVYHALAIVIPIAFYAMSVGMTLPHCTAASLKNFPHIAGTASSLSGIIQNTLAAASGIAVAYFYNNTPTVMMGFVLAGGVGGLLAYIFLLPQAEKQAR